MIGVLLMGITDWASPSRFFINHANNWGLIEARGLIEGWGFIGERGLIGDLGSKFWKLVGWF